MDRARWERVQALFHATADLSPAERAAHLERACAGDAGLIADVEALVVEDARAGSLLDRGVADLAGRVFDGGAADGLPPAGAFGRYRIERRLGEGGMGIVYLASRADLGSVVAIKVLRDAWLSPERRARFVAEQRTLAQLDHPAIARIHDADTLADGTPWFAMEYVEGRPLTEHCSERATPLEGRLELLRAVCGAVQHAHGQAVIHRDLKPSNVLVKADGTVKLLDFGIAKHLDPLDAPTERTRTGLRLMTPAYAAPEQLRGERVGVQTDVWALGVMLYELLAGRLPFDLAERTPLEAVAIVTQDDPEPPSTVARTGDGDPHPTRRGATWSDLDVLCLTALHKDPARRYRTVEAFARDIDHFLAGQPLEARPDAWGYRLRKFVGRHRLAVAAGALGAALLLGLVAFYTGRLASARNAAVAEAGRAQRIQRFMLNLFEGGDEVAGPANDLRVVTLLERGVREAQALDREPVVQAELYRTLGGIHAKLGQFEQAESLLQAAIERQRALLGADDPDVGPSLVDLGLLRVEQARLEEAERLVREGLALARRAHGPRHPAVARATAALGVVLEARGRYDEAVAINEEAVRLHARAGEESPEQIDALGQLADSHFYAGHYDAADEINARVLAATRSLYGEHHPRVAAVLINLGASQFDRGRYVEAETFYVQALETLSAFHGPDHFATASAMTMLGRTLVYQNEFDEAVPLLERALAIQERVHGPVHPRVASALNDLGGAALQQDRLDDAEAAFRRMLAIYRQVYGQEHYLLGLATANIASVLSDKREYAEAETLFREAIAIYERTQGPSHFNAGIGRIKLGRVLLRQGRIAEAERESRAGYEILAGQVAPSVSWLRAARADLVQVYEALGRPADAARFRNDGV
jgi:serine/threonine-protein kinase